MSAFLRFEKTLDTLESLFRTPWFKLKGCWLILWNHTTLKGFMQTIAQLQVVL